MQTSSDDYKKALSRRAVDVFYCVVSTQVLNEFCNVALKKLALSPGQIIVLLRAIEKTCEISAVTIETSVKAMQLSERYGFSYYDSLIVASALETKCGLLLSEDMQDGQIIESQMEIVNIYTRPPFL
jgi:predicted nucleic acid-binding protein